MMSRPAHNARRLTELAEEVGVFATTPREQPLSTPSRVPSCTSAADIGRAISVLAERRKSRPGYRDPRKGVKALFKSDRKKDVAGNPETWVWSPDELDLALESVGADDRGLVSALLDLGANVNTVRAPEPKAKERRASTVPSARRSTIVARTASLHRYGTLQLLASRGADQQVLDEGLQAALEVRNLQCVRELLSRGADPNKQAQAFEAAVWNGDDEMIRLFLRSPKGLEPVHISAALKATVDRKSLPLLTLLLVHGADPNHQNAWAFKSALESRDFELAIALATLGNTKLLPTTLDSETLAIVNGIPDLSGLKHFIELLLCCGLPPETAGLGERLMDAVQNDWTEMTKLLIYHGVSPNVNGAESLISAVRKSDYGLANTLLEGHISSENASQVLQQIPRRRPSTDQSKVVRENLIRQLIAKGATGQPLGQWLIIAADQDDHELLDLLVHNNAPLDTDNARVLHSALSSRDLRKFSRLLEGNSAVEALNMTLPSVRKLLPREDWLQATRLLLQAGAEGMNVDLALEHSVGEGTNCIELTEALLQSGAMVNYRCLDLAIQQRDVNTLQRLCAAKPSADIVSSALPLALESLSRDRHCSLHMAHLLLCAGARGKNMDLALVQAVDDGYHSLGLIEELLQRNARVNLECLRLAVVKGNVQVLQRLCGAADLPSSMLSDVLPLALNGSQGTQRETSSQMIKLLIDNGANGEGLHRTLELAVEGGPENARLISRLVGRGADVNYNNASPLLASLKVHGLVAVLLKSQTITQMSVARAVQVVFRNAGFDIAQARMLLQRSQDPALVNSLMMAEFESETHHRIEVIALLLEFGADVNFDVGQALVSAVDRQDLELMKLLLDKKPNLTSKHRAFDSVLRMRNGTSKLELMHLILSAVVDQGQMDAALITETAKATSTRDLSNVKMLMKHGATGSSNDCQAFTSAVTAVNPQLTRALLGTSPSPTTITNAFRTSTRTSSPMRAAKLETAKILLEAGVDQPAIDAALRATLDPDNVHWGAQSRELIDLLLHHKANVNTVDGTCFTHAIRKDDIGLLNKLLDHGPKFESILPNLIGSELGENTLVETLELVFKHPQAPASMDITQPSGIHLFFTAMHNYPQGKRIAEFFLTHGCSPAISIPHVLDQQIGPEDVSALLWTLDPGNTISHSVVNVLLKFSACVTFQAYRSGLTPLVLAIREGNTDTAIKLLDSGADVSVVDHLDRTPLFYACVKSNRTIANRLIRAEAPRNDGSLHEAARSLDFDLASMLVADGHEPDYPSSFHEGRSALGEICRNASDISSPERRTQLRKMMKLLLSNKSDPNLQVQGRSVVFLALDNPTDAQIMTKALLDAVPYPALNEPQNTYHDIATGLLYSALSYVEHGMYTSSPRQKSDLMKVLCDKRCQQRYYSTRGNQPNRAIGMPPAQQQQYEAEIEHKERLRRDREAEEQALQQLERRHSLLIQQKRIEEAEALQQQDARHTLGIQQQHTRHSVAMNQQRDLDRHKRIALDEYAVAQNRVEGNAHALRLARITESAELQLKTDTKRHHLLLDQETNQAIARRHFSDNDRRAELEHGRKLLIQQQGGLEDKIKTEQKALAYKEGIDKRGIDRRMGMLRETERVQSRLAMRDQQAIGWVEPD